MLVLRLLTRLALLYNPVGPFRTRLGNYTQINGKTIAVSGTRRAVDQAGVADEYAYQLKKRGTELRRDVERDLIHWFNGYQVANGVQGNSARTLGGYPGIRKRCCRHCKLMLISVLGC